MPSLRIPFPEKEQTSLIVLRSTRITVGRTPDNAIQIPDRTVSAHHAEIIAENGHYRVHDLGATNGIQVNGEVVTDFQLEEGCKVTFGTVECEFSLESPGEEAADPAKTLVSRGEADALKQEVTALQSQVAAYRLEAETLRQEHAAREGEPTVSQAEFDRVTSELSGMTLKAVEADRQIAELKSQLGVLSRDRVNLQRALDEAKLKVSAESTPVEEAPPVEMPPIADAPQEEQSAPTAETLPTQAPEALVPEATSGSESTASTPSETEAAPAEPAAPTPAQTMPPPKPKPLFAPGGGSRPGAFPAKPVTTVAATRAPGQPGVAANGNGAASRNAALKPAAFAKPVASPGTNPGAAAFQGKPGLAAKAGIPTKPFAAVPKAVPAGAKPVATPAGPKGTQKLS